MVRFPMFRLATLLAWQLSTPIADRIKVFTRRHPRYGHMLCAGAGRVFHVLELRLRLWMLGLSQPRHMPPISQKNALDAGAYILGEVVLFAIGGAIAVLEVNRQASKLDDKVLDKELYAKLEELQNELVVQQQDLDRLQGKLRALAGSPPAPRGVDVSPALPATPAPRAPASPHPEEGPPPALPLPADECDD
ncbi:unnamed protein product [Chrysodeixis includens]|uniref:OPA3-like protein n=1 Tax=Chrysodeixis includens TaxID=689277 RepID=A0A9N8L1Q4_CHRIL|nr:unnamed protein product [Chrysodeixis includens]